MLISSSVLELYLPNSQRTNDANLLSDDQIKICKTGSLLIDSYILLCKISYFIRPEK